ncbi:hypothetical protein LOZ53_005710 [Ophidiomyces ophidiicola]|uniref:Uncharacterized protein n=1 Tax=Ophidiomyces ophidiicola TaxID=1387563 RepID=A0ACB8UY84_9EURO|nr:uncharacterized protein LOZ57_004240 [Ophidiomyces ophidiicola]KAI1920288.1 hypothetical protein LOZ64_001915 [Ophidiomyces ophidiicola]KAI1945210.1 hypothetical protein LOZ57_004240 [Ophidiomyces ophidiicola]KAI1945572.1 hypothetical protein LOZ62_003761 [Ophidiomyces ophidiicola]KAI1972307.1 hypothetical protein LOZ56_002524 [Ophidiomyces ophidiicola]KAI1976696.1 hypothetical protein LOZ55_004119 [Ophidiomyces ophidiicola]
MSSDQVTHILNYLSNTKSLPVSRTWISNFISSQRSTSVPLPALTQTALFRLLASDFTISLAPTITHLLPPRISDPGVKEIKISGPVPLQVLDIEDIGNSLWSQIEAIEQVERGETTRGKEIIRTVTRDEGGDVTVGTNDANSSSVSQQEAGNATSSAGPHRLILEDASGEKVTSFELKPIAGIAIGKLHIGAKLLVKNATVARGMLLLEPQCVTVLGGKVEVADAAWKAERKDKMLARVQQLQPQ